MPKTTKGKYTHDPSGLFHYQYELAGFVETAAEDAISYRSWVSWFWFNGTPVPIEATDTPATLAARWEQWRQSWQLAPEILTRFKEYAGIGK